MSSGLGLSGGRHVHIGRVAVCTLLGAAFGGIAGMVYSAGTKKGMTTIEDASCGVLAGLVAITACCTHIHPWEAGAIAFIGGLLACRSCKLLEWLVIDDPVLHVDLRIRDRPLQTDKYTSTLKDKPMKRSLKGLYRGKNSMTRVAEPSAFMHEPTIDLSLQSRGEGMRATWSTMKWPAPH